MVGLRVLASILRILVIKTAYAQGVIVIVSIIGDCWFGTHYKLNSPKIRAIGWVGLSTKYDLQTIRAQVQGLVMK